MPTPINRFPIPMRGNELGARKMASGYWVFPIPMRGNEIEAVGGDVAHVLKVSDPHEG